MMDSLDKCRTCGAMVGRLSKHRAWHTTLDAELERSGARLT